MNAYKAVLFHNLGIMTLTGVVFILSDCNLWTLLILLGLFRTRSKYEEE